MNEPADFSEGKRSEGSTLSEARPPKFATAREAHEQRVGMGCVLAVLLWVSQIPFVDSFFLVLDSNAWYLFFGVARHGQAGDVHHVWPEDLWRAATFAIYPAILLCWGLFLRNHFFVRMQLAILLIFWGTVFVCYIIWLGLRFT